MTSDLLIYGEGEQIISAEYLIAFQEFAAEKGVPPQVALEGSGVPMQILIQPQAKVRDRSYEVIVKNVLNATQNPWLSIEYGRYLTLSQHGVLGMAAQNSQSLAEAAGLLIDYVGTRAQGEEFDFVLDEEYAHLRLPNHTGREVEIELFHALTTFVNLEMIARKLIGGAGIDAPVDIRVAYPKPEGECPNNILPPGVNIIFDQLVNEIRFPVHYVFEPLPHSNPELVEMAQAKCEEEMTRLNVKRDVVSMVKHCIQGKEGGLPTIDLVAQELFMSTRTLKRKLNEKGTSYQRIKDSVRFRRAIHLLEVTDDTMEKLAERLGYSNASNFNKAFKSWAAMSPTEYRQQLKEEA